MSQQPHPSSSNVHNIHSRDWVSEEIMGCPQAREANLGVAIKLRALVGDLKNG